MSKRLPRGYRVIKPADDVPKLNVQEKLVDLCRCGHLGTDHAGPAGQGACTKCDCPQLYWKTYVIQQS